jgi:hypothetical protein
VQFQPELRHTPTKIDKEPLRIRPMLEAADEIVGLCRLRDYADCDVNPLVGGVMGWDWSA